MRLELKNINKSFNKKQILHNVSFSIESGKAMGFLGRNGAGKTTTIRTLMNVFKPDSGEFLLDGEAFDRRKYKIGYLPEERGMYQKINIIDQLVYFGELKGMKSKEARKSALQLLEKVELSEYANKKLETLSKGNQQKVQILQAIINEPDIVVFDEPFSGLDPVNSMVLKDIISEFIRKNRIVIFSSHQMSYVEEFCDDVTFIKQGKIILSDNLERIKADKGNGKYLIESNSSELFEKLNKIRSISILDEIKSGYIFGLNEDMDTNQILQEIIGNNIEILRFEPYKPSLEEIFIELDKEV
ncbi:ATP-binding cassette domain-containing protein [Helcococcus ovis]|uniref:ATP-binding cassette domain-containing protein n=1 Tax=Helcococcus ovis TaxID=72026 RepID=A0A4R9C178_9FIRM|nr:ATP-binding cassette domain-containing protein [Helcococcus ovis]TFF63877.1 ATP-binding cassette domain-containing protein [Helcococcus ovis]TFF65661.1 ATP-binding cassette domain-containing protein [Helcococcus ovis]